MKLRITSFNKAAFIASHRRKGTPEHIIRKLLAKELSKHRKNKKKNKYIGGSKKRYGRK